MRCYGGGAFVRCEACGGEEGGGDEGAAEAEEVEGYEEEFVEGADGEEDVLFFLDRVVS